MKAPIHLPSPYLTLAAAAATVIAAVIQYTSTSDTLSLSRAIGWDWDINQFMPWGIKFPFISMVLFTIGYLLLFIARKPANSLLAILHILLTLLYSFLGTVEPLLAAWMVIGCWAVFVLNLISLRRSNR